MLSIRRLAFVRWSDFAPIIHLGGQAGRLFFWLVCGVLLLADGPLGNRFSVAAELSDKRPWELQFEPLPALPDPLGVAGPFVGVHRDVLLVAGGANFPRPYWEASKRWRDQIYAFVGTAGEGQWVPAGRLPVEVAYGASVSLPTGVLCLGGNDARRNSSDAFLLCWDDTLRSVSVRKWPRLPERIAYTQAVLLDQTVYLFGGQRGASLGSATNELWALDLSTYLSTEDEEDLPTWRQLAPCPGPSRAFHLLAAQHDGFHWSLYVVSGRTEVAGAHGEARVEFLTDTWQYTPATGSWRRRSDAPRCVMAGTAAAWGQSHLFVFGGADGTLFHDADRLKDQHPGFPKRALAYHTITDTWIDAGATPGNQVTTQAVTWRGRIVIPSGEVRPRVRTSNVWAVAPVSRTQDFGTLNYVVLFGYLAAMVAVGIYFTNKNRNTDDYFRGGKRMPWWAAGCSIFATMLSSLTYTGIPSKAYAQDWVYAVGNLMIPIVAIIAVFVALPFYRRIDATSAYEYLEQRFNRLVRLFASTSFTLFHLFRMAVVMSLTALALSAATPLSPVESVLLMGTLSIVYCTLGGIEAVIWTDTIQTVVLLGGAVVAFALLVAGVDGGLGGMMETASAADKLRVANLTWDPTSMHIALWVIVVGGLGQNFASYTADQAVVQRYMTTPDERLAARSIWTNALLAIPATLIFFGIGTALFAFYRSHPERLDPSITTDQVFPLFIAREIPAGLAGLIVAGIFAAAQSTVSTSMNSTATTIVTDFVRPLRLINGELAYLWVARLATLLMGIAGTWLGLVFVDPQIRSLFDAFIKVIGLFMGVLGGLFILGALTRRANSAGAVAGAIVGAGTMYALWQYTSLSGYLYTASGITVCVVVGYLVSLLANARMHAMDRR